MPVNHSRSRIGAAGHAAIQLLINMSDTSYDPDAFVRAFYANNVPEPDTAFEFSNERWDPARLPMLIKRMKRLAKNEEMREERETICGDDEIDFEVEEPCVLQMLWKATEKVIEGIAKKPGVVWKGLPRKPAVDPSPAAPAVNEPNAPATPKEQAREKKNTEKPFTCPICSHAFPQSHGLYRHSNTHKERRFKCPAEDCTYAATEKRHIQKHLQLKHKINI